jgi:hypothetical protein
VIVGPQEDKEVVIFFKDFLHARIDGNDVTINPLTFELGARLVVLSV